MTLTFGSLFTGFGGADIGAAAAGFTPLWGVEYMADIAQRARSLDTPATDVSLQEVGRRFVEMGIPSPKGTPRWMSIPRMYRKKVYAGVWEYGRTKSEMVDTPAGKKRVVKGRRSDDEVAGVKAPAVISMPAWRHLQVVLDGKRALFKKPPKFQYLMRGCIRCARCGHVMAGTPVYSEHAKERAYLYYDCRYSRHPGVAPCKVRKLPAAQVDAAVWRAVVHWLTRPDSTQRADNADNFDSLRQTQAALRRQRDALDKEMGRLLAFVRKATSRAAQAEARKQEQDISRRMAGVDEQIAGIERQIDTAKRAQADRQAALTLRDALAERIRAPMAFAAQRTVIEAFQVSAVWDTDAGTLTILSPFVDQPEVLKALPGKRLRF